jgi:hypothetical protein
MNLENGTIHPHLSMINDDVELISRFRASLKHMIRLALHLHHPQERCSTRRARHRECETRASELLVQDKWCVERDAIDGDGGDEDILIARTRCTNGGTMNNHLREDGRAECVSCVARLWVETERGPRRPGGTKNKSTECQTRWTGVSKRHLRITCQCREYQSFH